MGNGSESLSLGPGSGAASGEAPVFLSIGQTRPTSAYPFRNPRPLAIAVTVFAAAQILAIALQAVGVVLRLDVLARFSAGQFPTQEAIASGARLGDNLVQGSSVAFLIAYVIGYCLGGRWIYVAACNVRALGAHGFDNTPGWAVGWYFIPFMNWFKPFSAMSEIDRASHAPEGWRSRGDPLILRYWWAGWVISGLAGYAIGIIPGEPTAADGLRTLSWFMLVFAVVEIAAVGLFLAVVWRIARAQMASRHRVNQVAEAFS